MTMSQTVEHCEMVEIGQHQHLPTQGCHHRLVTLLLLWVSVLTIGQVLSITLYLTSGAHVLDLTTELPGNPNTVKSVQTTPTEASMTSGKILIYAYHGLKHTKDEAYRLKWLWQNEQTTSPVSIENEIMEVREDGSYFLYVQVSLDSITAPEHKVKVMLHTEKDSVILEGQVCNLTRTTGFLGKAVLLSAGNKLEVTISPKSTVNSTYTVTYMGIYKFPH